MTRKYARLSGLTDAQYLNLRARILFKQDFKCKDCGKNLSEFARGEYELSHIEPNLRYTNESNCEVLCPSCHAMKDPQRRTKQSFVFCSLCSSALSSAQQNRNQFICLDCQSYFCGSECFDLHKTNPEFCKRQY